MNRETRDKMVSGTGPDLTAGNACWETPPLIYADICERFGMPNADGLRRFDLDLTGDACRALECQYFGPGSNLGADALTAIWHIHGFNGYSNPPYGRFIGKILKKALLEAGAGFTSVFLIPMRATKAVQRYALAPDTAAEFWIASRRIVFFENGAPRVSFDKRGKPRADTAVFDSCLVVYRPGHVGRPAIGVWDVPKHVTPEDIARAEVRARLAALPAIDAAASAFA